MIKTLKAFTLIELLVVVSIILIITSSGTLYFFGFLDSNKLKTNIETIKVDINKLDLKIKSYEIFDYEINLLAGSMGYTYYINNFDIPYYQNINFDSITGTGIIQTNATLSGIRTLKIYKKHKLLIEIVLDATDTYIGNFTGAIFYKIIGTISGENLNEIGIKYFTENNVFKENEDYLFLSGIYEDKDKTIECNEVLKIINIGGKKQIYCGSIQDSSKISRVYLFFEQNGKEEFIEIN